MASRQKHQIFGEAAALSATPGHSHWPFRHQGSCWKATVRCLRKWWSPAVVENGQKFHKFFGTLNQGIPKIDNPQFCQARSSVRELPGFERWLHHLLLWGFTLSSHSWFTCCIDLIFQEENMKNRKQFFSRKTLGHQKKGGKQLGGNFLSPPQNFLAVGVFVIFQQILWAACKLAAFS